MFEPTLVVTGISGPVKVVRKCYGEMTPERENRETREVYYRADQLNPAKFEKQREYEYVPVDRDDDEEPSYRPMQMGRRR